MDPGSLAGECWAGKELGGGVSRWCGRRRGSLGERFKIQDTSCGTVPAGLPRPSWRLLEHPLLTSRHLDRHSPIIHPANASSILASLTSPRLFHPSRALASITIPAPTTPMLSGIHPSRGLSERQGGSHDGWCREWIGVGGGSVSGRMPRDRISYTCRTLLPLSPLQHLLAPTAAWKGVDMETIVPPEAEEPWIGKPLMGQELGMV